MDTPAPEEHITSNTEQEQFQTLIYDKLPIDGYDFKCTRQQNCNSCTRKNITRGNELISNETTMNIKHVNNIDGTNNLQKSHRLKLVPQIPMQILLPNGYSTAMQSQERAIHSYHEKLNDTSTTPTINIGQLMSVSNKIVAMETKMDHLATTLLGWRSDLGVLREEINSMMCYPENEVR